MTDDAYLRERYGSTEGKNRILWLGGAIAAIIVGGWLIWHAITLLQPSVHYSFINGTIISENSIRARYNVTSDIGQKVRCTVHAYNESSVEVGIQEVETTITAQPTTVEVDLVTTQPPARADVSECTIVK
ncbi:MAG: DUF4307 domain-containing protein [Bowdeniella nasicola]|nr:DUF4307 domain-containing protein [Bowdeniella nasicola]